MDTLKSLLTSLKAIPSFFSKRTSQEEIRKLWKFLEINKYLNSELNPKNLLSRIIDSAVEITGAERGFLILKGERGNTIEVARNIDHEEISKPEFKISHSIANQAIEGGIPILADNAAKDGRFNPYRSVASLKLKSVLCIPLRAKDRIIGAIYMDNRFRSSTFTHEDLRLMEAFGDQAGIALENARLLAEKEAVTRELERLNWELEGRVEIKENELRKAQEELFRQKEEIRLKYRYDNIVGRGVRMREILSLVDKTTDTDVPVLIEGESGTGKELIARAIHYNGSRQNKRFVSENCSAISESLLASELFGYVKGAFTGASSDHKGLFELANGGTLFLDEIGDMDLDMQKKLLRAIQEKEIRPVGGNRTIKLDVRLITATNQNLKKLVEEKKFREDLYYRLKVIRIVLPPLRERREDIPLLINHFLERIAQERGEQKRKITDELVHYLTNLPWPGNVRELENEIRRMVAVGPEILHLSLVTTLEEERKRAGSLQAQWRGKTLKELEREAVITALREAAGNRTRAAEILGIPRRTLYEKLKRHGLETKHVQKKREEGEEG